MNYNVNVLMDKSNQLRSTAIKQVKLLEENFLEIIECVQDSDIDADNRWLNIARTDIEKGVMAFIRSVKGQ